VATSLKGIICVLHIVVTSIGCHEFGVAKCDETVKKMSWQGAKVGV
jgi:hypothetical protein